MPGGSGGWAVGRTKRGGGCGGGEAGSGEETVVGAGPTCGDMSRVAVTPAASGTFDASALVACVASEDGGGGGGGGVAGVAAAFVRPPSAVASIARCRSRTLAGVGDTIDPCMAEASSARAPRSPMARGVAMAAGRCPATGITTGRATSGVAVTEADAAAAAAATVDVATAIAVGGVAGTAAVTTVGV